MTDLGPEARWRGRRVKPVALGVTVMMVGLTIAGILNLGEYPYYGFQAVGALVPAAAAALLAYGWWKNDTRWTRYGLELGFFTYVGRAVFLAIVDPFGDSLLLALGTTIIIGGTYILETRDRPWTP